jgi:shikimate dehydrogenase
MYRHLGLEYVYVAFGIADSRAAADAIRTLGIRGVGVTMPHKVAIMPFLDRIDPVALEIGAVNTIVNDEGILTGYNVDWLGAVRALEERDVVIAGQRAFVVGAGGAARAVAFGLKRQGASVSIFNRTPDKARGLAESLGVNFGGDLRALTGEYEILVHATSAGYVSQPEVCVVPRSILEPGKVVMDIVAEPLPSPLQTLAESAGCLTIPGDRMRLHQAAAQFEMYTGRVPPLELMGAALLRAMAGER